MSRILKAFALLAMPLALAGFFLFTHPFREELVTRVYSLNELSPVQEANITVAARALNGYVIEPNELFSFNRIVGPRTDARGYRSAPSYVGPNSPSTFGGGICLVSSALYQCALILGLPINERVSHLRPISSVNFGQDATVWYGQSDLKFSNNIKEALQLKAEVKDHKLYIKLLSANKPNVETAELKSVVARRSRRELLVEVFRDTKGKRTFISRDHYSFH